MQGLLWMLSVALQLPRIASSRIIGKNTFQCSCAASRAATTFLEAASGDYGAHGKVARMLRGRNVAPRGGARRDPLRDVTFGRPEGEAFDPSRNLFWRATGGRPEGALAAVLGRAAAGVARTTTGRTNGRR